MVELKKKVTLKTKVAEPVTTNTTPETANKKTSNDGKKWVVVVLLIFVAIIALLFLKYESGENTSLVASNEIVVQQNEVSSNQNIEQPAYNADDISFNKENFETNNNSNTIEEKPKVALQSVTNEESSVVESNNLNLPLSTIEEKARLVIRGDFGNGEERKHKLGSDYSVIQRRVNEMYSQGLVH